VSKGHFLIGDGIADSIFGHRSSRSFGLLEMEMSLFAAVSVTERVESRGREPWLLLVIL
jgi:hypothetical protein